MRQLVWEPIDKALPPATEVVYLTPDGPLTAIPWAALPGKKPGTVLLEDYALALVPHGPLLLDQLTHPIPFSAGSPGQVLAVGDVQYDERPAARVDPNMKMLAGNELAGNQRLRSAAEGKGSAASLAALSGTQERTGRSRRVGRQPLAGIASLAPGPAPPPCP